VFVRENGVWTQQGKKLVGTSGLKSPLQGFEVAVSADGNTLASFGLGDDWFRGAAWVFTRTGKTWTQQGPKLVASGLSDVKEQGGGSFHYPIALSADGNTLLLSGATLKTPSKYVAEGIFFTRNNGVWTEQQSRIKHPSGWGGQTLAMSADATTAILGDPKYDNQKGGAWIFIKQGANWVQQGSVLSPPGGESGTLRGSTVALSADGNTAIVGEYGALTTHYPGAIWIYRRTGGIWALQGGKLRGAEVDAYCLSGSVVAISADGTTSVNAGQNFSSGKGAAWIFVNEPQKPPTVTTLPITNLSFSAATLNGSATDNGSQTDVSIEYGTSASLSDGAVAALTKGTNPMPVGSGTAYFESKLTGLKPQTTYYFRIVAVNSGGQASGAILSFTTPAKPLLPPIVTTTPATLVSTTGATMNGTADDNGNETNVTFEWSLSADLSGSTKKLVSNGPTPLPADAGTTLYSTVLSGLVSNTRYYYRIVGVNAGGTSAGQIMSFVTEAILPPLATTLKASQVFSTTAIINGEVNGHESNTDVSFFISTSPILKNAVQVAINSGISPIPPSSGIKQFSALLAALAPKTTYYYRISATNTGGASNGDILSFITRLTDQTDPGLIPNTFTPNDDGINDTWEITGFEASPVFELKVFNRYGVLVHSSKGTSVSWDGKSKNQPLMIGTYFYIINFGTAKKSISGGITILR
jgi:gliding motility-associated-like protein